MHSFSKPRKIKRRGKSINVYYVKAYDKETGKQTWISTGQRTLKLANEWVKTKLVEEALGIRGERKKRDALTFEDACTAWVSEKVGRVSESYVDTLRYRSERWTTYFGKTVLRAVDRDLVVRYLRKRHSGAAKLTRRSGKPLAAATMNTELRLLRGFFNYCLEREWIDKSPLRGVKNFSGEMKRRVRSLTQKQEERLIEACRTAPVIAIEARRNRGGRRGGASSPDKVKYQQSAPPPSYLASLVLVALNTGFRKRTLFSLRWKHLDFENCCWRVPAELTKTASDYEAPVPELVIDELRDYRKRVSEDCSRRGESPLERLGRNATIFGLEAHSSVKKSFKSAAIRAGLEGLTLHDCRRIYLNKLRESGVALETAMALTGHRSVSTVMKHYREVPRRDLQEAVSALDRRARESRDPAPPADAEPPTSAG